MGDNCIHIAELAESSGVRFGTSGIRGRVEDLSDRVCYAYTQAFLQHVKAQDARDFQAVAVAGDLRDSTPRILSAVARAIADMDLGVLNCGFVPTPAVAAYAIQRGVPSIMVTGSHIPDDRNGIKFYSPVGEILKADEQAINARELNLSETLFDAEGALRNGFPLPPAAPDAEQTYVRRYLDFFPEGLLADLRVGVYEHSSVARDIMVRVLEGLGARVVRLGHSPSFVPVDTEAVREVDVRLARKWADEHRLAAIVSTDGDGDRPLIADERGRWLRGDVVGVLCARHLGARCLVTPISSNSLVQCCGLFERVERTRIGSPFVIEAVNRLLAEGHTGVCGYEANGGFLQGDALTRDGRVLPPLLTRDAIIVMLSVLAEVCLQRRRLSDLLGDLPPRFTASDRLKQIPQAVAFPLLDQLRDDADAPLRRRLAETLGELEQVDDTDGLRLIFANGEVVHLRQSGNAPELRCYTEAASEERASELNRWALDLLAAEISPRDADIVGA